MNLPAVELAIQSNHYCHAQKDAGSHPDPKKQMARRKLYVASAICLVFMIGEIIGKAMGELTEVVHLTGAETLNPARVFQGLESHQRTELGELTPWGNFIPGPHFAGGYLAHSLAIMTDAAHLLTDFASMLISLFSLWVSSRPATKTMNFGWQRAGKDPRGPQTGLMQERKPGSE